MKRIRFLLLVVLLCVCCRYAARIVWVPTGSMEPTIQAESLHLFVRLLREPRPGDIVMIDTDEQLLVKRVIATGGQIVTIAGGKVYVDDQLLEEDYLHAGTVTEGDGTYFVEPGKIFFLGDNRPESVDSRMLDSLDGMRVKYVFLV